ncbi:MAG: CDP-alcohol phosphatidyltransferase family protein [Candidatus Algichlamydia australiensis]|nr:CDP-alcohol phosphatidyltransferase family protein [Chlamydiales bacterium]
MRQVYLVPNIITAFGLSCGLYVIFKANLIGEDMGIYGVLLSSSLLLILASFADFLDGAVARVLHAESEFGLMFDSLSDAITFGVAPSVLLVKSLSPELGTPLSFFVVLGAMLFSLCGVLRLVRYNVKAAEKKEKPKEEKPSFTGLPIPSAALAALSINLFLNSPKGELWFPMSMMTKSIVLTLCTLFVGCLMVSKIKFPSLKALHIRVPSVHLLFATVIFAIFLLYGILYQFTLVFTILTWGYIFTALALLVTHYIVGKRTNALKAFDPDDEEE